MLEVWANLVMRARASTIWVVDLVRTHRNGEAMSRRITGVAVKDTQAIRRPISLLDTFRREESKETGRFGRALSFLILIGAIARAFRGKDTATASSALCNGKRSLEMKSAAAAATSRRNDENRSILSTVLEQNDLVESDTDDLFELAARSSPEEFRRTYESEVSGLKGFSTSIRGLVKSL